METIGHLLSLKRLLNDNHVNREQQTDCAHGAATQNLRNKVITFIRKF